MVVLSEFVSAAFVTWMPVEWRLGSILVSGASFSVCSLVSRSHQQKKKKKIGLFGFFTPTQRTSYYRLAACLKPRKFWWFLIFKKNGGRSENDVFISFFYSCTANSVCATIKYILQIFNISNPRNSITSFSDSIQLTAKPPARCLQPPVGLLHQTSCKVDQHLFLFLICGEFTDCKTKNSWWKCLRNTF